MTDPRTAFDLDPGVHHLNHGSFGAVTLRVQEAQARLRRRIERDPMAFFTDALLDELDAARRHLAAFLRSDPADLVFVRNATEGVSSVLGSLRFSPSDEILVNNHEYRACLNACARTGARVVEVELPLPVTSESAVIERILAAVTDRTRLALVSHVTSPTGLVLPLEAILDGLTARGVPVLVDGAHAPGMIDLDLVSLGARGLAYYTANLHKWVCGPKGSAFLWVAPHLQDAIYPPVTSHGYGASWPGRTALQTRFDWTGTDDPTPFLVVPTVLEVLDSLHPRGISGVRAANRALALEARALLERALGVEPLAPEKMIGSLAAVRLPDDPGPPRPHALARSKLQSRLHEEGFRVPVMDWPRAPQRLLRVSAHRYNRREEYERLAARLGPLLEAEREGFTR